MEHLRFLWEQNVRALADDPFDDAEGWIENVIAAGPHVGRDFWEFVDSDSEITDFERERLHHQQMKARMSMPDRARRMGYADPPYPGQAERLYGDHPDYAGEVDHHELICDLLAQFPFGWALSTSVRALPTVLRSCPDRVLVCCWLKRATSPPMGDNRMYSWEPVILCDTPNPQAPTRIHCEANADQYTFRQKREGYVVGAKPKAFSYWLFDAMGLRPDDEFVDVFPGSGAVGEAWESWRAQERLAIA